MVFPDIPLLLLSGFFGLIFGSFLSSLTWRLAQNKFEWRLLRRKTPRNDVIARPEGSWQSRSMCPQCGKQIAWYDNVPMLSYILLGGKCRSCRKPISLRYPVIEFITALTFSILAWAYSTQTSVLLLIWKEWMGVLTLPFFLFVACALLAIAIVDYEHQIIPDSFVIPLIILLGIVLISSPTPLLFHHFFWAGAGAVVILFLYVVTLGRGMGLGDVKLITALGLLLGSALPIAFFLSVFLGAGIGILLLALKKAKLGKPIPFGPFLILGTFLTILFEDKIWQMLAGGIQ